MAPQQPVTNAILDPLDITNTPKPFKSPHWKSPLRRNKNLKQILQDAARAQAALLNPPTNNTTTVATNSTTTTNVNTPIPSSSTTAITDLQSKSAPVSTSSAVGATYTNIESAPSLHPARAHWCDITGLPAKYTDPKTKLRYADKEVYKAIHSLPPGSAEGYLELRGANVVLK